jgi:hypothetical protein
MPNILASANNYSPMLTASQQSSFRLIFIPGLLMAAFMAAARYYTVVEVGSESIDYRSYTITRPLEWLVPYLMPVFCFLCWGWDWLMQGQYRKLGWLLLAPAADWVLNMGLQVNAQLAGSDFWVAGEGAESVLKFLYRLLLTPFTWYGIIRGLIEGNKRTVLSGYLAAVFVVLIARAMQNTGFGGPSMFKPFFDTVGQFWQGRRWQFWLDTEFHQLLQLLFYFLLPGLTLWLYYFFTNLLAHNSFTMRQVFRPAGYPSIGPWHFAFLYGAFYVTCFGCTFRLLNEWLQLLNPDEPVWGVYRFNALLNVLVYAGLLYFFFHLLRNATMGRCMRLHHKIGLWYLLFFIPLLNIIPFVYFISKRSHFSEADEMDYAETMNDEDRCHDRLAIGAVFFLSSIPLFLLVLNGVHGTGGLVFLLIYLLHMILLGVWRLQPRARYLVLALYIAVCLYYLLNRDEMGRYALEAAFTKLLTLILSLAWYQKIFHPGVHIEVDYRFAEPQHDDRPQTGILSEKDLGTEPSE